jgi:hypothetical protein
MKKTQGIMILTILTAGLTVGGVSAAELGGAPVTLNTPVPAPTKVSTPVPHHHHHHHALSQSGTNTVVGTTTPGLSPAPVATPQPIAIPSIH